MWGPWGAPMWGYWGIGALIFLVCVAMMVRFMSGTHGPMCIGGHGSHGPDAYENLRREIRELREEIRKLTGRGGPA